MHREHLGILLYAVTTPFFEPVSYLFNNATCVLVVQEAQLKEGILFKSQEIQTSSQFVFQ